MTDEATKRPPIVPRDATPVIFFDACLASAHFNSVIACTLSAALHSLDANNRVQTEISAVAHLRTNIQGAIALRKALDDALMLALPVEGGAKN